ncbi:ferritin-like fold-containing protein [Humibacter ginsengisoli]
MGSVTPWFARRTPPVDAPKLKPRREQAAGTRVDLHDIAPDLLPYLGQVAYLQLQAFETLSGVVQKVPSLTSKEMISLAAGAALSKHQSVVAEIRRHEAEPADVMAPFALAIDGFQAITIGRDWQETLLAVYVTDGLLSDFFMRLAQGLPGDVGPRAASLLGAQGSTEQLAGILELEIQADATLGSRLAMWGRRLVGDTLLVARSALKLSGNQRSDEERIDPVFTEIIGAHTRRMDALGLTA